MNSALVIIPTYNELENLGPITEAVLKVDPRVDILVCDDNSPDGTGKLADELAAKNERIRVLHREKKEGLGRAYIAAFKWALKENYQYIIEMDADFSHDPRFLPKLIDTAVNEADLALGSRYVEGGGTVNWGVSRQIISKGGSLYARSILGVKVRDLTGGFKCFNRRVLEAIDLDTVQSSGYGFQIELTYRTLKKGFTVKEIPIVFEDRRVGQSKMSRKIFLEAASMVWKLRFTV
ncbi:MAG: dolichyl-phosphate beta-D-mannosyltransferase [Archangium gephyra]|uniref:Dolichyl-phosphate beta-D-mannosyltransferase n=1 Tax=Archangium gephyra TaxID=48 RepID=A0A2W5TAH9_9BACT|nr:MAG: dolichyl-phosphate beta-D-mannosyltransferase [Archangium gephyra]